VTQPRIIHRAVPIWAAGSASATPLGHRSDCQCDEACRYGDSHFRFDPNLSALMDAQRQSKVQQHVRASDFASPINY